MYLLVCFASWLCGFVCIVLVLLCCICFIVLWVWLFNGCVFRGYLGLVSELFSLRAFVLGLLSSFTLCFFCCFLLLTGVGLTLCC